MGEDFTCCTVLSSSPQGCSRKKQEKQTGMRRSGESHDLFDSLRKQEEETIYLFIYSP